jgi:hypothetical protein
MKPLPIIMVTVIVLAVALAFTANAAAERHPSYLHALTDLRTARAYLNREDGGQLHEQERGAIEQIDQAIGEIKAAAIDDGKNLNDHPSLDTHLPWIGRLNKATTLLNKAHDDVAKEEDDPATQGLQARALEHIGKAHKLVQQAIALEQ